MIIPDVNLLLYAYDADSPSHLKAADWWSECLSGSESIGIPLVVLFAFVRLGTNARIYKDPMTPAEAAGHVRSWFERDHVQVLESGHNYVERVLSLLENVGTAGNLTTDAQIVALTFDYDATLHTNDTDFMRFQGVRWYNPLTEGTSAKQEPRSG